MGSDGWLPWQVSRKLDEASEFLPNQARADLPISLLPLHQHQADSIPMLLARMRTRLIAQRHNADHIRLQMKVRLHILADG